MIDKANGEPTNGGSIKPSKKAKCEIRFVWF